MSTHSQNGHLPPFAWSGETLWDKTLLTYTRRVPDHPLKTRFIRLLLRSIYAHGMNVRSPQGTTLKIDVQDFIGERILREGAYEPISLARASALMSQGGVFVDAGANFGLYTCTLGLLPDVRCIAIDAHAAAFTQLKHNVELNPGISADLVNVALSSSSGIKGLELPRRDNLGMARISDGGPPSHYVATATLSDVLELFEPGPIRLLKIDVEGHELEVFRGLDWAGEFRPDHILMEFTDEIRTKWQTPRQCLQFLREHGYAPYTVDGDPYQEGIRVPEDNLWLKSVQRRAE